MRTDTTQAINRNDYTPPSYWVETVEIGFDLDPALTRVAARTRLKRNPASRNKAIVLYGEELELVQLRMNGRLLAQHEYQLMDGALHIAKAPDKLKLEIETNISQER